MYLPAHLASLVKAEIEAGLFSTEEYRDEGLVGGLRLGSEEADDNNRGPRLRGKHARARRAIADVGGAQ